jgi:hypothetical protein
MIENDQILEFIDGALDGDAEQRLFNEMVTRPEMRTALRQYIAIGEGVRADREAFSPPAHLEQALMTGLGLAPFLAEMTAGTAAAGAGWLARLGILGSKFWPLATAFTIGAILAGGGTYLATRGNSQTIVQVAQPAQQESKQGSTPQGTTAAPSNQSSTPSFAQPVPQSPTSQPVGQLASRERVSDISPRSSSRTDSRRRMSTTTPNDNNGMRTDEITPPALSNQQPDNQLPTISATQLQSAPQQVQSVKAINDVGDTALHPMLAPPAPLPEPLRSPEVKPTERIAVLSLEVRKQFAEQIFVNNARQMPSQFLEEDIAGGLYWSASKSLKLGVEGGQERYAQTLAVFHGDTMFVEQMPSYSWGGVTARYSFDVMPSIGLRPFGQVSAAFSTAGPLARGRFGLNLPIFGNLSASGALEVSSLFYSYGGQSLVAGRWGFTTGLEFGF